MALTFVGLNQPAEKTAENATLIFNCKVKPDGEKTREVAVGFDIKEYARAKLNRDLSDNNRLFSWSSHWKPVADESGKPKYEIDDPRYVETDSKKYRSKGNKFEFKPSLASMFRLSYLEQIGMRESDAYKDAINALPDDEFSESDKAELLKVSNSHGKPRGSAESIEDKTQKIMATVKDHGIAIVDSHLTPAEMADLADTIEEVAKQVAENCRRPLQVADKKAAERRKLVQAIEDAEKAVEETLQGNSIKAARQAFDAKVAAQTALAEFDATAEQTADATAEDESDATAEQTADATAEDESDATAEQTAA